MYSEIESLPDSSRLWMYTANRVLNEEELYTANKALEEFCTHWTAHNKALVASYQIYFGCVFLVAVDESAAESASGCSIDKSVGFFRALEEEMGISVFDRFTLVIQSEEGSVTIRNREQLQEMSDTGNLFSDLRILNTSVDTLGAFRRQPFVTLTSSWVPRFFKLSERQENAEGLETV